MLRDRDREPALFHANVKDVVTRFDLAAIFCYLVVGKMAKVEFKGVLWHSGERLGWL
jgi:hypothetical protein